MLASLIAIPSIILGLVLFVLAYTGYIGFHLKWIGVIPFAIGVGAYIIRHGINEWWYSKYPPGLSDEEKNILARFFPYYRKLNVRLKKEFEDRLSIFRLQKKFEMRLLDKIPGDLQLLVCATGIQLTMGFPREREFLKNLGMVVLFPKEFFTPDINTQLHHVEVNKDIFDCLLISINFFSKGLRLPNLYYNSGLHGMAKVFRFDKGISDEDIPYEGTLKELLVKLHLLRDFKIGYQFQYTGLPDMEAFEMATEHFFTCPEHLKKVLPEVYEYLMDIYNQDPINNTNPVIQSSNLDNSSTNQAA